MILSRTPDFLTEAERTDIRDWALTNRETFIVIDKYQRPQRTGTKYSCSLGLPMGWSCPHVGDLHKRIALLVPEWTAMPQKVQRRIVVHEPDSETFNHVDQSHREGYEPLRTNILIQAADGGGDFKIKNQTTSLEESELLVFMPDEPHHVTPTTAGIRVLLTFGWYRLKE